MTTDLLRTLAGIVGEENVLTGDDDKAFYSMDIYSTAKVPASCIVRPCTREEVARITGAATEAGCPVIARGGGTSYTGGYLPVRENTVLVDMQRLDRVVEVNTGDMYVTVEVGCTWKNLFLALKEKGVRTPFWGPLSGGLATVGGSLSQHAILLGSAAHGSSADSVLGLEVVLADGSIVVTGSGSSLQGKPFFRHYGPDLTGMFLGDTGALGLKVQATLRLVKTPAEADFASFAFDTHGRMARAMTEVAREGLATECFGMDPVLQAQRMKRTSLSQDLKSLKGVMKAAGGLTGAVKEAVKIAAAGRSFLDDVNYSVHLCVEGRDRNDVAGKMKAIRSICTREGREVENTIPKVIHADPFVPMSSAIGPEGERWAPVHGIVPLSEAAEAWSAVQKVLAEYKEPFDRHGIVVGVLLAVVGASGFVIEPVFYWPGPRPVYYDRVLEPSYLARLKNFEHDPGCAETVAEARKRLFQRFTELGAVHLQIGKTYPYRQGRRPETWKLLEAIKNAVDPSRLINPGSLGLD